MDLRNVGWGDMDWIDLAQDMDRWRALLNTMRGISRVDEDLLTSQEGHCYMELVSIKCGLNSRASIQDASRNPRESSNDWPSSSC
jgi:hypothetical protein